MTAQDVTLEVFDGNRSEFLRLGGLEKSGGECMDVFYHTLTSNFISVNSKCGMSLSLRVISLRTALVYIDVSTLKAMWDEWDNWIEDESTCPLPIHYDDIHEQLNLRGHGTYCAV